MHLPGVRRLVCWSVAASVVMAMLCAVGLGSARADELANMAREAKAKFRPLTADDLKQAKQKLNTVAALLGSQLDTAGANGGTWKTFLRWSDLEQQLQKDAPDAAVLTTIYAKFAAGHEGLELSSFADVRDALRQYLEVAGAVGSGELKSAYEQQLEQLAVRLEAYAAKPTTQLSTEIGQSLAWLQSAGQASELVTAIRARYVHPNCCAEIQGDALKAAIAEPVDQTEPNSDVILGTIIHGVGRTVGQTTANLVPSENFGMFDTVLTATNTSQNVGQNGPVCLYTQSTTALGATKRFWLDVNGLNSYPTVSQAATKSTINDIEAQRRLVERVAWRQAGQKEPEADQIASQHAEQRLNRRVDAQAATAIERFNQDYERKIRGPLVNRNAFPQTVQFTTTAEKIQFLGLRAGADQLAAATQPPELSVASDMSVRIHESMINNMAATVLSGMIFREDMFQSAVTDFLGHVPEQFKPDDNEPWTVVFARREPFSVSFTDNGFSVTFRGREYFKGERGHPGMDVTARYKFVTTDHGPKAVRQGDLEIFPPGFVQGKSESLGVRQQVIKSLLQRRFGKIFDTELVPKGITPSGRLAKMGHLDPVELTARDGWLLIGWRRAPNAPPPAAQTEPAAPAETVAPAAPAAVQ